MIETISSLAMPLVVLGAGLLMLFGKRDYFSVFCMGARDGLQTAIGLFPTLSALMVAVAMLNASGAVDFMVTLNCVRFEWL